MSTPQFSITLTHTGLLPNGSPNTSDVLIDDLEVGYEFQLRKVPVYVPVLAGGAPGTHGSITIPLSANGLLSFASGVIAKFVASGVITAQLYIQLANFTNTNRPSASSYPIGSSIWNTSDNSPNYSDGTNWRDAMGNIT